MPDRRGSSRGRPPHRAARGSGSGRRTREHAGSRFRKSGRGARTGGGGIAGPSRLSPDPMPRRSASTAARGRSPVNRALAAATAYAPARPGVPSGAASNQESIGREFVPVSAGGKRMRKAYHADSALEAEAQLTALAKELDKTHPGAAGSLREGMAETPTVLRPDIPRRADGAALMRGRDGRRGVQAVPTRERPPAPAPTASRAGTARRSQGHRCRLQHSRRERSLLLTGPVHRSPTELGISSLGEQPGDCLIEVYSLRLACVENVWSRGDCAAAAVPKYSRRPQ